MFRKLDMFPFSGEGQTPAVLGPLARANPQSLALLKGLW
jgi:hypothetical protein